VISSQIDTHGTGTNVVFLPAKNGEWTAEIHVQGAPAFYLHSKYEPTKEAINFINGQTRYLGEENPTKIIVYGAGCGHHINALLHRVGQLPVTIEVWETNVHAFHCALDKGVYSDLLDNQHVTFVVSDDLKEFAKRIRTWEHEQIQVIVHEPSLKMMPRALQSLQEVLKDYQVRQNTTVAFRHLLDTNFTHNMKNEWPGISAFLQLPPVPVLLISAGPSLQYSFEQLRRAHKHCMLGAVGTAMAPLIKKGIFPDFFVMIDPKPNMLSQLEGWESKDIPLFFLATLYSGVIEAYQGPKYILFQEGYSPSEKEAERRGEPLVKTGGSVSTTMFSLSRLLQFHPICLVGQDLAYTNNTSHVEGASLQQAWTEEARGERVLAVNQKDTVTTSRNLLMYKKWFEEQAQESDEIFYNATEGGAYIEGFSHTTLKDFLYQFKSYDATETRAKFRDIVRMTTDKEL